MWIWIVTSCGIIGSIINLCYIYKWCQEDREKLEANLSENFDLVDATIDDTAIGQISYPKTKRFIPYIKYTYEYDDVEYTNDTYSYPIEYDYSSDIDVRRKLESYEACNFKVYVDPKRPQRSYVEIYDHKIEKDIRRSTDCYVLWTIFPLTVIGTCMVIIGNTIRDMY